MDEIVLKSMAKWPDVPAAFGWLSLDRRGDWRIRGARVSHAGLSEFIGRNYASDADGRWYFQNGPQRVYVRLECLPYVLRLVGTGTEARLITHTGHAVSRIEGVWIDDEGSFILGFEDTAGLLSERDIADFLRLLVNEHGVPVNDDEMEAALAAAQLGEDPQLRLRMTGIDQPIRHCAARDLETLFRFVRTPQPAPGQPEC